MCSTSDHQIKKNIPPSHHARLTAFNLAVLYHAKGEPIEMQRIIKMAEEYSEDYFQFDFPGVI